MKVRSVAGLLLPFVVASVSIRASAEPEATGPPEPTVLVGEPLRRLALALDDRTVDALRERRWDAALTGLKAMDSHALTGGQRGDWAFLVAWCHAHGDTPEQGESIVGWLDGAVTPPQAYRALVRGEIAKASGDAVEALSWLARVPETSVVWPRAAMQQAEALRELDRTKEAFTVYERLAARDDPSAGSDKALQALAEHRGIGSPEALPFLLRLWEHYPTTDEARVAAGHLAAYAEAEHRPDWRQVARRAERWMYAGAYNKALSELQPVLDQATDRSQDACRVRYVRGRSYYKMNELTNAVDAFGDIGTRCTDAEGSYGPRGLYLLGTAQFRRKRFESSASAYRLLVDEYTEHSMADDALTRGGISLQEAGDLAQAQVWWKEGLERFPAGDTIKEATFRLAFSLYLGGQPEEARDIALRLGALDEAGDEVHVHAGRYWAARWLVYPDVESPTTLTSDPEAVAAAIDAWRALCEDQPHSFYAILAYARLVELAPDVAATLAAQPHGDPGRAEHWSVRLSVVDDPAMHDAVALLRLGLVQEALTELGPVDDDALTGDEKAWLTELRIASSDWLLAHDDMRHWLVDHPLGTLGPQEDLVVRVAYPDRYWDEVQTSVRDGYLYEPRLFHALVREESNFNRKIISFAGARGLSQLMPATARQTAGWLGMTVTMPALEDPQTNLNIGAKYLDAMHKQLSTSPYLALAAYNGGAGNVNKWITRFDNPPIDEYVEQIPYRETRGYVRRVMGSWQTYRWTVDEGPAFPDLSRFNHKAKP